MFLEDGEFTRADELCEQVLNQNPECAEAYLGKLMAELKVRQREELKDCEKPFSDSKNYQKAMRFGNAALQEELNGYINFINERITAERIEAEKRALRLSDLKKQYNEKYREAVRLNKPFIKNRLDALESENNEKEGLSSILLKYLLLLCGIVCASLGLFAIIYDNIICGYPIELSIVLSAVIGGLILIPFIKERERRIHRKKEINALRKQLAIIDNTPTFETFVRNIEREEKAREQAKVSR